MVELRPDDPIANNNLAYALLVTGGDMEEALTRAEKATQTMPANPYFLHTLGVAQMRSGKLDDAAQSLRMAISQRPGDPTVLLDYGQLLIKQGETDRGRDHIRQAIRFSEQLGIDFPRKDEAEALVQQGNAVT